VHRTSEAWVELMNEAGVPCGPILSIDGVFADPQVRHLGMVAEAEHPVRGRIGLVAQPVTLSRTPWALRRLTPECGEHTEEVLAGHGYSGEAIAKLREEAVI
jgi:crotonobetainyl-CoA:carnitine CoA-transferase CaiB-like acyl-CoA transferase